MKKPRGQLKLRFSGPRKKRRGQLSFPLPRVTAAERKAWIRERLVGYEFRQAAREESRRRANRRRILREQGEVLELSSSARQLSIPTEAN